MRQWIDRWLSRFASGVEWAREQWYRHGRSSDLAELCEQWAALLEAGLPADTSLRHVNRPLGRRCGVWTAAALEALEGGKPIAPAWSRLAPPLLAAFLAAGEASGRIADMLALWAAHERGRRTWFGRFARTLSYPLLLTATTMGALLFCGQVVTPALEQVFRQMQVAPPASFRWVQAGLRALPTALAAGSFIAALSGWVVWYRGRVRFQQGGGVRLPVIGSVLRTAKTGTFCVWLDVMLSAGLPVVDALQAIAQSLAPLWMRVRAEQIWQRILEGQTLAEAFAGDWDPLLPMLLHTAEATGDTPQALRRMSRYAERDLTRRLERWARWSEPVFTILTAGLVGVTLYAVLVPMYEVVNVIA
ncbi:MAG: type II secretion system F family protein [Alicyclobacillaceae bacterium]|nr:type II secretion system F family protein [Alicyclobacillaceae bacterium]